jgi:8-oxo-dGTP pyrophosphatase MutT (NUDIX family)
MHSDVVSAGKLELVRPRERRGTAFTEVLISTTTRTPRGREQVAAVCYRIRRSKIEFLLVRTRKGRWTFPKGGMVRGFTRAQSAALEALEEGGVHGRIEEASFIRYSLRKNGGSESEIHAFLCEVLRTNAPQEMNRQPTWFATEKAQLRLKEQRTDENGDELASVVERAVSRIKRLADQDHKGTEPLRSVQFEASETNERGLVARFAILPALGDKSRENSRRVIEIDGELDEDAGETARSGSEHVVKFRPR